MSPSRRSRRIGSDSIRVGLPDVSNAANASQQVGQTAQLYFYDWEPNVIPNPVTTNVPSERGIVPALLRRGQGRLPADARVLPEQVHDQRAAATTCSTRRPTPTSPGPPRTRRTCSPTCLVRSGLPTPQILTVPQGTLVVEKEPAQGESAPPDTVAGKNSASWFVIRDRPALSGTDITDPKPNFDQFNNQPTSPSASPTTGRQAFSDVTKTIAAARAPERSAGSGGQFSARRSVLRPLRGRPRPGRSSRGRSSTSSTTPTGSTAARAPQISGGFTPAGVPGPGARSSRSAPCRST